MNIQTFMQDHEYEARIFGVTPLSRSKLRQLYARTFTVGEAYSVACDVYNGFTFKSAVAAVIRMRNARRLDNVTYLDFGV